MSMAAYLYRETFGIPEIRVKPSALAMAKGAVRQRHLTYPIHIAV